MGKKARIPGDRSQSPSFVELPNGLFTASGLWFHTSVRDLEEFAGPVLEKVGLDRLLDRAAAWVRSPGTFSLWIVLIALGTRSVSVALLAGIVGVAGWTLLAPGLVLRPLVRLAQVLEHPLLVGGAYVIGLSAAASGHHLVAVGAGLTWFIAVRWGLVDRALRPVLDPVRKRLYRLSPPDQILRGLLIRHALAMRVSVGDLDRMERRMMEIARRHRNG